MTSDRLTILHALAPLTGTLAAWLNLLAQWPGDTREEGIAFWGLLSPSAKSLTNKYGSAEISLEVYQALERKFGQGLWNDATLSAHPLETMWSAVRGFAKGTTDWQDDTDSFAMFHFFMDGTAPEIRQKMATQGTWVARVFPWLTRVSDEDHKRGAIVRRLFAEKWVSVQATWNGQPLASLLRHPSDIQGWLAGGGDPNQVGLDPTHPGRQLWEIWHDSNPHLRDVILEAVPAAAALRSRPDPQRAVTLETQLEEIQRNRGRTPAATWWATLTADPDWASFRAKKGQMPLWLAALNANPALLPHVCAHATQNESFRACLGDTDSQGRGIWTVLLRRADSRSLTEPLLKRVAQWVPPATMRPWWQTLGTPEESRNHVLGYGFDTNLYMYGKNSLLRTVLTPRVMLGSPEQMQVLFNQWDRHVGAWYDIAAHLPIFRNALTPEFHVTALVAKALAELKSKRQSDLDQSKSREEALQEASKAVTELPLEHPLPPRLGDALQKIQKANKDRWSNFDALIQFERLIQAGERARKARSTVLPDSGPARKRYRS